MQDMFCHCWVEAKAGRFTAQAEVQEKASPGLSLADMNRKIPYGMPKYCKMKSLEISFNLTLIVGRTITSVKTDMHSIRTLYQVDDGGDYTDSSDDEDES